MANLEIIVRVFIQVQHTSMMSLLQHNKLLLNSRTLGYYFGGLKEMHCEKIETLTIISRSSAIMPGLKIVLHYLEGHRSEDFTVLSLLLGHHS